MKESLFDSFQDEYGMIDFTRTTGMSKSKAATAFISALTKVAQKEGNSLFSIQVKLILSLFSLLTVTPLQKMQKIAKLMQLEVDSFQTFIDILNDRGFLLKKGYNTYELNTT